VRLNSYIITRLIGGVAGEPGFPAIESFWARLSVSSCKNFCQSLYRMVLSKLNKNISYTELKGVNKNDLKMEVNLYQLEILEIDVIVAVGNSVNTFEDENVTYFPLYLVKSNNKIMQIGVYEIHSTDLSHFLDDEGSLDLEKMDDPLIYKFVTKSMLL